jgi:hypothetical protein
VSMLAKLKAIAAPPTAAAPKHYEGRARPVEESDDLHRIMDLPRRAIPSEEEQARMAAHMTAKLRRDRAPGTCDCARLRPEVVARGQNPCLTDFRPTQGWYLYELAHLGGAVGLIEVGGGKTALDIFAAMVVPDVKLAVLLISPSAVEQFLHDYKCWSQHFNVPNLAGGPGPFFPDRPVLEIFPYSQLQQQKNATWLKDRNPDLLIGDEAQMLKDRKSTRTGRFLRFFADSEQEKGFCCHSGSFTTREIQDCAHLLALSLREGSPFPLDPSTVDMWGDTLNPSNPFPTDPGALRRLCQGDETIFQAVHKRLVETPGVIATRGVSVTAKLRIKALPVELPAALDLMLREVRAEEKRPDGEVLLDQLEVAACLSQLSCGFYYYWAYPRGEPRELIDEWFDRRQEYNKEVRVRLMRREDQMDSPGLLQDAAVRWHEGYEWTDENGKLYREGPRSKNGPLPTWDSEHWEEWARVRDLVVPEPRVEWVDDFLAQAAADWARREPGVVWYLFAPFGAKVEELSGLVRHGGGDEASAAIRQEKGDRSIVASIKAHHKEKNLQSFYRNLVANPPADGGIWEQLLGRSHRYGQPRDEVETYVFRHAAEHRAALDTARNFARYAQALTGNVQRLLLAEYDFEIDE